ncbi:hypothetical protein D9615_000186 [Tricholomella constricta]|uniref:NAD-dependent protein deacylase n=1 Tax=Tricholomella constricta TaxID=117010 RepID=A0A8H5HQU8_9AGAR|nr:hypothetical protein D9615_000186 [Tricholomella constricta]
MPSTPLHDMQAFQAALKSSKHIIAIAGAGLSAASGIPTFRGAGGMWRKYDAMSLATPEAFSKNPSLVWQFYHYRRETALKALPNAAHFSLAVLSLASARENVAPDATFTLITQNVDGLSARALEQTLSAHTAQSDVQDEALKLLEMHGRLFDVKCTSKSCGHTEFDTTSPICASLAGTEALIAAGDAEPDIQVAELPRCSKCNALARPGVVWFHEIPLHLRAIRSLVNRADLCLVVGTSSTVYPAAGYASQVQENGGKVAVFNLERSSGDEEANFLFLGPCEETLPKALGLTT